MIKVLLSGVDGAMGHVLTEMISQNDDFEIIAGFDNHPVDADFPVYEDLSDCHEKADVIIDFSHYSVFDQVFDYALTMEIPIVVATTGLSDSQMEKLASGAHRIPVFKTANMSLGINVLAKALKDMAPVFGDFDIEILEKHHNKKADAPSGTALLLADTVNDALTEKKEYIFGRHGRNAKRQHSEIGIHALRGGTIPGEHTVMFAGNDEIIEVKHSALSKKVFANGALTAARFLIDQPAGLYDMQDVLA